MTWDGTRPHPDAHIEREIAFHERQQRECFRFNIGDSVWVRDAGKSANSRMGGYRIVEATVRERHYHPGRQPFYPHGEGYALDGQLWWDCYPGCRVWGSRKEAVDARLTREFVDARFYPVAST